MVPLAPGGAKHERAGASLPRGHGVLVGGHCSTGVSAPRRAAGLFLELGAGPVPLLGPLAGHWDLPSAPGRGCLFPALAALLGEKLLHFTQQALPSESLSYWSFQRFSVISVPFTS